MSDESSIVLSQEATTCKPSDIKRVSKDTVNKLLSAQVILNIGIAIKELIENSVDAQATIIEIKVKNYGLEGFEVSDNGTGIDESNFHGITAKHHTSKLKAFSDLESIGTFGFRGEALSSLCGLSDVVITTRHSSAEYATKLVYDHDGQITEKSTIARNVGTSVVVSDFFKTLPVRKAEFQKNHKKDYTKMVQLLQEYCLVLTGVKIICTNHPKNGSRTTVLSTTGKSIIDNIISIFGSKQSQEIIRIKCPTNDGTEDGIYTQESIFDITNMTDVKPKEIDNLNQRRFKIDGFISNIDHNCGRSLKDRQYIYVNSRPCEMRQVSKLVNEIYHRYNMKQYPFLYLNLKIDQSNVDVNLSKDKRQVAICDDKVLLLVVKRSLLDTFGDLPTKFKFGSLNSSVKKMNQSDEESDEDDKVKIVEANSNFGASLKLWKLNPGNLVPKINIPKKKVENSQASQDKVPKIDSFLYKRPLDTSKSGEDEDDEQMAKKLAIESSQMSLQSGSQISSSKSFGSKSDSSEIEFLSPKITSTQEDFSYKIDCKPKKSECTLKFEKADSSKQSIDISNNSINQSKNESNDHGDEVIMLEDDASDLPSKEPNKIFELPEDSLNDSKSFNLSALNSTKNLTIELDVSKSIEKFKSLLTISIDRIKSEAVEEELAFVALKDSQSEKSFKLKFKESIDPSKNKKAEAELETEIKKDMFKDMKVLGQFNLGFIIAQLGQDLFIVDQHATDERYNFEKLEKHLKIETQSMVVPEKLELTAVQEDVIIDNLDIFEMNGFKFDIDKDGRPTQRISLISRPYSKTWEFGREDIEEMIFMLRDHTPNSVCRPSRIRAMLASRACRKSVMIGTALAHKNMKELLVHMGEIDHPWNCPHGRPTIRFLQNLDFIDHQLDEKS